METTLAATLRTDLDGKGAARKLRREGKIPAVIYGPDHEPRAVTVDPHDLYEIFRVSQNRNTVLQLQVDGETVPCLVRDVQRNPLTRELLHIDFYRVKAERPVEVMVPLRPIGKAKGFTVGGKLRLIRRELPVRCAYDRIPEALQADITHLDLGDNLRVSEIKAPEGVEIVFEHDFNVAAVQGRRVSAKGEEKKKK